MAVATAAPAARYLADKSALARARHEAVGQRLEELLAERRLCSCSIIDLEVLFSARGPADYREVSLERRLAFPQVEIGQPTFDRALEVQALLAEAGQHRAASIPDLLIAACAEQHGLTVLHYDADFDRLAELTGQPTEWVVSRGEAG